MDGSIRIFVTGGTFDKEYNEISGDLYFKDSHVPRVLQMGRARLDVHIRTLMMVDSRSMSEEDRMTIAKNCRAASEERIIITHGTDTIVETARLLAAEIRDKTVVLTGAMIPYTFGSSDGLFNLGSAIAFVQAMPHGVYVAMNGRAFDWDNVRKNRKTGEFEELES